VSPDRTDYSADHGTNRPGDHKASPNTLHLTIFHDERQQGGRDHDPAKTCTKQTGWPPLPMTAKRTIAAKILPAWTRRFGSIALLDIIPRIRVVIRSKDLHVLCYSRAFRVSSVSSRVKGPGCNRSRSRATKETRRLALAVVATTCSSLTASV
jgi:hypothetical protein